MSQALRKLSGSLAKHNKTVLIFINQIRHKVGVMFGSPEVTSGGQALKVTTKNVLIFFFTYLERIFLLKRLVLCDC